MASSSVTFKSLFFLVIIVLFFDNHCVDAKSSLLFTSFMARSSFVGKIDSVSQVRQRVPLRANTIKPVSLKETPQNGGMSNTASTVSLTKNIIGAGILALPAGMAVGGGTGQISATVMAVSSALVSTYSFNLIGRVVAATGARNFRELWGNTIGTQSAWVIDLLIFGVCGGALLVYSCFLGDLLSSLFQTSRSSAVTVSSLLLVPLVLLPDMSALAPLAYTGLAAVLYTTWFIVKRCLEGDSPLLPFPFPPQLDQLSLTGVSIGSAVLFNMLSTAFMAHTNAVRYYNELSERSLKNFYKVSAVGFGAATLFFITVMLAGYRTFGAASQGLILNNYASGDVWGQIARGATALSIVATYPLVFTSLRDVTVSSIKSRFPKTALVSSVAWTALSITLLSAISFIAAVTSDVGMVVSLSGSLFGAALIFCVPSAMFIKAATRNQLITTRFEVSMVRLLFLFGVLSAALGTTVSVMGV